MAEAKEPKFGKEYCLVTRHSNGRPVEFHVVFDEKDRRYKIKGEGCPAGLQRHVATGPTTLKYTGILKWLIAKGLVS